MSEARKLGDSMRLVGGGRQSVKGAGDTHTHTLVRTRTDHFLLHILIAGCLLTRQADLNRHLPGGRIKIVTVSHNIAFEDINEHNNSVQKYNCAS